MSAIITLPSVAKAPYVHMGSCSGYERFTHTKIGETGFIQKIKYNPDNNYSITDGTIGKCWEVEILDTKDQTIAQYYIRDWQDLVHHFTPLKIE